MFYLQFRKSHVPRYKCVSDTSFKADKPMEIAIHRHKRNHVFLVTS